MNYYAALDVSLRSVHLCVIDNQGELITETKLSSKVTDIIAYLDALELKVSVVGLEAGTLAQYLTYGLQSVGFEMMVCSYYLLRCVDGMDLGFSRVACSLTQETRSATVMLLDIAVGTETSRWLGPHCQTEHKPGNSVAAVIMAALLVVDTVASASGCAALKTRELIN